MASVKESKINDNTLIGLDKICFAINSIETEKDKIEKDPTKADFIKAPMALFAFDTEVEKVVVAKLDVDKVYEDFGVIPENTNFGIKGSIAKILLESFNVSLKPPNTKEIQKSELSKITSNGTLHLSCWMTVAQIQAMQSQRVLFEKFD